MYIRDAQITWIWIYDNSWKKVPTVELIYFLAKHYIKSTPVMIAYGCPGFDILWRFVQCCINMQ